MADPFSDNDAFITVWDTRNVRDAQERHTPLFKGVHDCYAEQISAPTGPRQVELPLVGPYTASWMRVDDPSQQGTQQGEDATVIDLPASGVYRIAVVGDIERIIINDYGDADKLIDVEQWGTATWQSMERAFRGARNMQMSATDAPDLSRVYTTNQMFEDAHAFDAPLNHWDVSTVERMSAMFRNARSFNQHLFAWDTGNVTTMSSMFAGAESFNGSVAGWDTSNVERLNCMFMNATSFNRPVNAWDTSSVFDMEHTFRNARSFNQNLDEWNVRLVRSCVCFLEGAVSFNGAMSGWDLVCMNSLAGMFRNAKAFNQPIGDWTFYDEWETDGYFPDLDEMFKGASSFNQPINRWAVPASASVERMFEGAQAFDQDLSDWEAEPDLSNLDLPDQEDSGLTVINRYEP
jgi:hypothetical protein